jgi:sec-independent protein translocase protein TatA
MTRSLGLAGFGVPEATSLSGADGLGLSWTPVAEMGRACLPRRPSMDAIGPWELLIIVLAIGLLFGANRLPQLARGLGEGIGELRSAPHQRSQPGSPGATQEPGADPPPER